MIKNILAKLIMACMVCNKIYLFSSISTPFTDNIEAVIFDCDGVLVDTEYLKFLAWQKALASLNIELSIEEYKNVAGHSSKKIIEMLKEKKAVDIPETVVPLRRTEYQQLQAKGVLPIKEMVEFARYLSQNRAIFGIKLGLASSASKNEILFNLREIRLENAFDVIISGTDDLENYTDIEGKNKPKPYIYLEASKRLKIAPEHCLVFEDTEAGIKAASTAGMIAIAVPNWISCEQNFSQANKVIYSMEGLMEEFLMKNLVSIQSHERMIETIILSHFGQPPKFVKRMVIGICNEVYEVGLNDREVIVRLSPYDKFLMGSHDHIPKFQALGIKVPEILAEDYRRSKIPFCYQIQSKIEGQDLGEVIATLSDEQLKGLAKEVSNIFNKVKTIPSSNKFGVIWGGGENEISDTWTERMHIWIEESRQRGVQSGVMDSEMETIAKNLYERYKPYFDSIKPTTYYGDICSKNIMIKNGAFNGLVDLDGLTQGDPLEAIGRIKLSWYGSRYGEFYSNAIMDELGLTTKQRELVTMYALLNKISWTCENGIQFNQNTRAEVDREKEKQDKMVIKLLATELQRHICH